MNLLFPKTKAEQILSSKPFLKWAGGKNQLLSKIEKAIPQQYFSGEPFTYIEPFVGGGAVLFWMLRSFPNLKKAIINDVNKDLIVTYQTIKNQPYLLIDALAILQKEYLNYSEHEDRKAYYLEKRALFNERNMTDLEVATMVIFLNRTCFNGLYRVNSKNKFNVPSGRYKNPKICNKELILADSLALQKVEILTGDYEKTLEFADKNSFYYLDPPYKPISSTSSFNAYAKDNFNDSEQERLKDFCDKLATQQSNWLLSNSDPKNVDAANDFFDNLYESYFIDRVKARRAINSNGSKRGEIFELLISNYEKKTAKGNL